MMGLRNLPPGSMPRQVGIVATAALVFTWTWAAASAWATWRVIEDTGHLKLTTQPWHPGAIALMVIALVSITAGATLITGWLWLSILESSHPRSPASVRSKAWMYACLSSAVGGLVMWVVLAYWDRTLPAATVMIGACYFGVWIGIRWTRLAVFKGRT